MLAADLGVDADMTSTLNGHVHKQMAYLGEPHADFGNQS